LTKSDKEKVLKIGQIFLSPAVQDFWLKNGKIIEKLIGVA